MLVSEHYIEAIATKLNLEIDHVRQVSLLSSSPPLLSTLLSLAPSLSHRSTFTPKVKRRTITNPYSIGIFLVCSLIVGRRASMTGGRLRSSSSIRSTGGGRGGFRCCRRSLG